VRTLVWGVDVRAASIVVAILFIGGGDPVHRRMGEYIGRIYEEVADAALPRRRDSGGGRQATPEPGGPHAPQPSTRR
jgi:hypothetical protein